MKSPEKMFKAYGSQNPLTVLGYFEAKVMVGTETTTNTFYVVKDGERNLLGKKTATALRVLKIGLNINTINDGPFPKFKDVIISVPIDKSVRPVCQPYRRVPIPLEAKINNKIQELIRLDIIEKVNSPSSWISPMVPVLKGDGDVRICIDMRRANEAIIRENHPLPRIDQLIPKFRKSQIFSRLDLKNGFHQVELSEECRYKTIFITNTGLYRYKRLMFGISCAPEYFQKIMERILLPCNGVVNVIDDIVVFRCNEIEHDIRLKKSFGGLERK